MIMNENYLWDRTGEPDPEIQELEDVLGVLRYQPKPLVVPVTIQPRRRSFFPALAIAASIVLMLLFAGLWLSLHRPTSREVANRNGVDRPAQTPQQSLNKELVAEQPGKQQVVINRGQATELHRESRRSTPRYLAGLRRRQLREKERKEAELAKEQLMLALRLASAKLNVAQRKAQGSSLPNIIRNRHKIG